jgi:ATPase family AAA domain-containing protein 1
LLARNIINSLQSTLADPEKEKHEQARIKAQANLERLRRSRHIENGGDGDGDGDESGGSARRGHRIEDLQLNEYENLVALEVVAPEDIPVGFDGMLKMTAAHPRVAG